MDVLAMVDLILYSQNKKSVVSLFAKVFLMVAKKNQVLLLLCWVTKIYPEDSKPGQSRVPHLFPGLLQEPNKLPLGRLL